MLHYKHKQHRYRRSHKALPFLHHKENDPCNGNSPKNALRWQQCFFPHRIKLRNLTAISSHCLAALPATDDFNSHMQLNVYYRNLNWNFVVMLLLHNESQLKNYPHPSFATYLCRQCSGHKWTARSKLDDTTTANPALAQCECHIRK